MRTHNEVPVRPKDWNTRRPSWHAALYALILRHNFGITNGDELRKRIRRRYPEREVQVQISEAS